MDRIIAVVDCQGFALTNVYLPRELALVSNKLSWCLELDIHTDFNSLSIEDQEIVKNTTHFQNGLHIKPFNDNDASFLHRYEEMGFILKEWYRFLARNNTDLFAFDNDFIGNCLREEGIPSIDLRESILNFPRYDDLRLRYNCNVICGYHKPFPGPRRTVGLPYVCAYRKCSQIFKEIKRRCMI